MIGGQSRSRLAAFLQELWNLDPYHIIEEQETLQSKAGTLHIYALPVANNNKPWMTTATLINADRNQMG